MRTTLKRGIGRGASANGNGRAVLPPGALSPISRYRQPPRRYRGLRVAGKLAGGFLAVVVLVAGGIAGGAYLFFHHSVAATAPRTAADKKATRQLADASDPSKPATALVIGYDKRYHEPGRSRSDTIMLVRTQPNPPAVSLLSFPRDLGVYVKCPGHDYGYDKINAAYSDCGSPGTLDTIRSLTGLQVNYLITVNFHGFQQVVDKLGGIWMDVDHRYYHSNAGTVPGSDERYSEINLFPGYQKLNGSQALSYVRYRHTDNDIYRTARQQAFVKAVREQISKVSITDIPRIISAVVHNVIVGKKGGGAPSDQTIFNYARFLYDMPKGNVFQVKIPDLQLGPSYVTASESSIQEAVREFQRPDVKAPEEAGSVVLHHRIGPKSRAPAPHQTSVTLLNGNGYAGSATLAANGLDSRGYRIVYPPNGIPADAPHRTFRTQIYFDPAIPRSKAAAHGLANVFGAAEVKRLPADVKPLSNGSMVVVVVGLTFHGSLAPAPVDHTPPKQPAQVTASPAHTRVLLRRASRKVPFRLEYPRLIAKTSSLDSALPIRTYAINGKDKAVRLTYVMGDGLDHWGIEETNWTDAPVLADSNFPHTIKGREFDFFWNGADLHMVVLHQNGATYWVMNSLLDTLSPQTMVAIAKSLTPLPPPRRKK